MTRGGSLVGTWYRVSLLVALGGVAIAGPVRSQDTTVAIDRAASEIYESVMSPYCPGLLLANCPSPQAADLREWIHAQLAAGTGKDAILGVLENTFGEEIRGAPRPRGLGLLAWLGPVVFVLGGGAGLWWWLRRASRRASRRSCRGCNALARSSAPAYLPTMKRPQAFPRPSGDPRRR
jgi:cytochrome c-type biogenesis protein CcmH/NrfF